MGNTAGQGNAAYDGGAAASAGNAAPGSAAAQPPVIPGLHPETQELLTARYGSSATRDDRPKERHGRPATVRYPFEALILGLIAAYAMLGILFETVFLLGPGFPVEPDSSRHQGLSAGLWNRFLGSVTAVGYLMLFALLPVILVGGPLAAGVARALRTMRNQGLHVLGFAVAGFLTPMPAVLLMGLGGTGAGFASWLLFGGAGALCAAVGRLAIWKLVEVTPAEAPAA